MPYLFVVEFSRRMCEAHSEVKMYKAHQHRTTFGSWDVEKVRIVVARSTFRSQNVQSTPTSEHFWTFRCRFAWQALGLCTLTKVSKMWGLCGISKTNGRRGTFEERICNAVSVAGAVQEPCLSEMLGGPGADFLRGVAFWSIRSSGLLRWFCVTGAALRMTWPHFFVAGKIL